MKFDLLDGGEDSEYNGTAFVEISKIFGMKNHFSLKNKHLTEFTSK